MNIIEYRGESIRFDILEGLFFVTLKNTDKKECFETYKEVKAYIEDNQINYTRVFPTKVIWGTQILEIIGYDNSHFIMANGERYPMNRNDIAFYADVNKEDYDNRQDLRKIVEQQKKEIDKMSKLIYAQYRDEMTSTQLVNWFKKQTLSATNKLIS